MAERYYTNDGKTYAITEGQLDNGKTLFCIYYNGNRYETMEAHEIKYYDWTKHLHGNAPSGTPYGSIRTSLYGRKRIILTM